MQRQDSRWLAAWCGALLLAALALGAVERYWRVRDYEPGVLDSAQLWSIQRDRLSSGEKTPLAILGASRIGFALDVPLFGELLPGYQPAMLAQSGHYPMATLRDLARDETFNGLVLCDVDANGLSLPYRGMQQAYVDYHRKQWTPSWHLHRLILNHWQEAAVIANPAFGALQTLKHQFTGSAPFRSHIGTHADRSGSLDFGKVDVAAFRRVFADGQRLNLEKHPPPSSETWLASLAPVAEWVKAIQRRGGKVLFLQMAAAGELRGLDTAAFPDAQYWDQLAAATGAATLKSSEIPAIDALELPDGSHLDQRDKPAFTRALVDALAERGFVQR